MPLTLDTLDLGETWVLSEETANCANLRTYACKLAHQSGKDFRVSCPLSQAGIITVTRIK